MKCPICVETDLLMTDRQGIEIDYCPKCRGVWLDRGELDKLIERSSTESSKAASQSPQQPMASQPQQQHIPPQPQPYYDKHDNRYYRHKKHKKESFLSDLFDF